MRATAMHVQVPDTSAAIAQTPNYERKVQSVQGPAATIVQASYTLTSSGDSPVRRRPLFVLACSEVVSPDIFKHRVLKTPMRSERAVQDKQAEYQALRAYGNQSGVQGLPYVGQVLYYAYQSVTSAIFGP